MADEVQADTLETTEGQQAPTTPGDATGTNSGETERTYSKADVEKLIKERLAHAQKSAEAQAKKAAEAAEAKALAEQGEWKKLAEKAQADLAEAQRQATEAQQALLRREVGAKYNLPPTLVDRLRGDTPEELDADAQALLAALPKPAAPNINSGTGNGRVPTPGVMDEQAKRELAAVLNVNPKYL